MSFPKYPKYKDSGVAWLGAVPEHWGVTRLKYVVRIITEKADTRRNPVALENIEGWSGRFIASSSEFEGEGTAFRRGDLLFGKLRPYLAKLFLAEDDGEAVGDFHVMRPTAAEVNGRFVQFQMLTPTFIDIVNGSTFGSKMPRASWESVGTMPFLLPPKSEQSAIASFIEHEAAKIDALVAEQEKLIALLKEKRQAVISRAVTKGLNPSAPMKDSGIQWLGQIPAHWEIRPLKKIARVNTGVAKGKDLSGIKTVTVPYLRVANVQDGYLDLEEVANIDIPERDLARYELRSGDVLMNEGGDFDKLGRGCVWDGQISPCITQNHVFAVRPEAVSSIWLSTIISSRYAQFFFMSRSKQSTNLASISSTNLMELPVVMPPEDEQASVLEFISKKNSEGAALIKEAERAVSLLQERRSALISAAVTGQIDVRQASERQTA